MLNIISKEEFIKSFKYDDLSHVYTDGLSTQFFDLSIISTLCNSFYCKNILEIGVRYGHTAKIILDQFSFIEKYYGIDVPYGFIPEIEKQKKEVPFQIGIMALEDKRFHPLLLKNGTKDLENEIDIINIKFDLIFIDADHSYNGVKRDTMIAKKIINKNGILIWHDYGCEIGVMKFINDFSKDEDIFYIKESFCCFKIF